MSDVVLSTTESVTTVTVVDDVVQVAVTTNPVTVTTQTAGVQGASYSKGDPIYEYVRNSTGTTLLKGQIVYLSGATGNHVNVSLAQASGDNTSARTIGWVSENIANNANGYVMMFGYLEGIDTSAANAVGDILYLSPTVAGGWTSTKPSAPQHLVYVGVCVRKNPSNGAVSVHIQNGYELGELHDVAISNPVNAQVLTYDSATDLWVNATNPADGVTSITATAPLTGGTITSTGSIGLDQTALSITKSQVSDFTSGTVTSAGTAQQAGTAVFANTSGTATYATTSGTAVTISGDITKSQVSDFTSGTVASASTAQQAGTAVYANTSGTATFATNAGTAVFATNASTAVTISGSITQSQVTDLTTDLANTAKLNTANTFSVGGHVINSSDVNTVPLAIRNATGQNGNSFEIRNNAGTPVLGIFQTGTVFFGPTQTTSGSFVSGISGRAFFNTTDAATSPLILRGATSQSADLQQWQNSSGTILSLVNSSGSFRVASIGAIAAGNAALTPGGDTNGFLLSTVNAGNKGLVIRGAASQSVDLFQVQNSAGTNLVRADQFGGLFSTYATFTSDAAGTRPLLVRGASGQTANLFEIQTSGASTLFRVDSAGSVFTGAQSITIPGTVGTNALRMRSTTDGVGNLVNLRFESSNGNLFDMGKNEVSSQQGSFYLYTGSALPIEIYNSAVKRLIIESTGNVNIGPTTGAGFARLTVFNDTATRVASAIRGAASQSANLLEIQNSAASVLLSVTSAGNLNAPGQVRVGTTSGLGQLAVVSTNAATIGAVVQGAVSQTANLQTWQDSSSNVLARVNASGIILGASLRTNTQYAQIKEENAGAALSLTKMTSQAGNDGAGIGRLYFRDGTNAGTLKLVVRAGAAGAETTILDNIPQ